MKHLPREPLSHTHTHTMAQTKFQSASKTVQYKIAPLVLVLIVLW